jgi:hypothetical protein
VFAGDYNGVLYALNERTGKLIWSGKAGNQFFDPDHIAVAGVSRLCRHDVTGRHDTSGADGLERLRLRERHLQAALDGPSVRSFRRPCDLRQDNLHSRSQSPIACLRRDRVRTFFMPTTVARHNLARSSQRPLHQSRDRERDHIRIPERPACRRVPSQRLRLIGANPLVGLLCTPDSTGESGSRPEHALRRNREGLEAFFPARCPVGTVCSTPTWIDPAAPGATLLVANGAVYANSALSVLADDATTGTRLWHTAIPGTNPPRNGPTVANGAVYVADTTGAEILAYHL